MAVMRSWRRWLPLDGTIGARQALSPGARQALSPGARQALMSHTPVNVFAVREPSGAPPQIPLRPQLSGVGS